MPTETQILHCEKCGLYPRYQHPQTGKIYKLCASCGWKALTKMLDFCDDNNESDTEKVDQVLKLNE
jgi:hypothetical protein